MSVLGAKMLLESREFSGNKSYVYMTRRWGGGVSCHSDQDIQKEMCSADCMFSVDRISRGLARGM